MKYITMRDLTTGADYGAQMMVLAGLYVVGQKTGHKPSIITNKDDVGYKLRIKNEIFPNFYKEFDRIDFTNHQWVYKHIDPEKFVDNDVYNLDKDINYNFPVSFSTYHYWKGYESQIKNLYNFNIELYQECKDYLNAIKGNRQEKEIVSVHFRRGDYLYLSSLKLSLDYYYEAVKHFDPTKHILLLFSNNEQDVNWAYENFKPEGFEIHTTDHRYPTRLDMCVMSLCDHNIIANSSYSWWGAYLNKNGDKKVICPYNYLDVSYLNYINGNYYPEEWISLKTV